MTTLSDAERAELLEAACAAADAAGALIREAFARPRAGYERKGAVDLVTETDTAAEACIRDVLAATGVPVLGEEGGLEGEEGALLWIVDPIDGTTNFAHRVPHLAVSIGLAVDGTPTLGVVDNPVLRERVATDGRVATCDGRVLPMLEARVLDEALLGTGFPYDRRTNPDNNVDLFEGFMKRCQGVRRFGAAALDLASVALGRLDGFWEPRLKPWDVCAGVALVRAVGGTVCDYGGGEHRLDAASLIAAHPELAAEMVLTITRIRTG